MKSSATFASIYLRSMNLDYILGHIKLNKAIFFSAMIFPWSGDASDMLFGHHIPATCD